MKPLLGTYSIRYIDRFSDFVLKCQGLEKQFLIITILSHRLGEYKGELVRSCNKITKLSKDLVKCNFIQFISCVDFFSPGKQRWQISDVFL
jgi:hypothetical protein